MPNLTSRCLLLLFPILLALVVSLPIVEGHAQEARTTSTITDGTGLEIDNYQSVRVVVEDLSKDSEQIGLTKDRIQARVELRLRQAKLKPGDRPDAFLNVLVFVYRDVFTINVAFWRGGFYAVSTGTKSCATGTWSTGVVGTHGNDSAIIVQGLDENLDKFLNEYLKANGQ